jgi:hypothetical protein
VRLRGTFTNALLNMGLFNMEVLKKELFNEELFNGELESKNWRATLKYHMHI